MNRRFLVEPSSATDQHEYDDDCTNAIIKAIINTMSNNSLSGLSEICALREPKELSRLNVDVKIGAPYPKRLDKNEVLKVSPLVKNQLR